MHFTLESLQAMVEDLERKNEESSQPAKFKLGYSSALLDLHFKMSEALLEHAERKLDGKHREK